MMPPRSPRRRLSAFTLIELLTVIAIIGILAAILIPTVGKVRTSARNAQCVSLLRDWGRAIRLYANENKGNYLFSGWASLGTTPYVNYLSTSPAQFRRFRSCPMLSQERIDAGTLTYTIVRGSIDGNINKVLANVNYVPFSKVRNPSQYLVICDAIANSGAYLTGTTGSIDSLLGPLFNPADPNEENRRHGSKNINGVFGDGSVRRISGSPAGSGDTSSVYEMRTTWFQLY